ncbi:MAG: DNA polymerase III subunit chi [Sneathiellales bacterium]|nr:DNA polymerase III subunit chi [Sneathiellales bacterium]
MAEVSFYHLQSEPVEKALPRLLEKIHSLGLKVLVRLKSETLQDQLDKALWTYSGASFLPHGKEQDPDPEQQPLLLSCDPLSNKNNATVLMMLEDVEAADLEDYDRCLYMFDSNDQDALQAARERWKAFKMEGVDVTYWQQGPGGWQKKA